MKQIVALLIVLIAWPVAGEETTSIRKFLDSLPPMTPSLRAKIDYETSSMYRNDCECLTFLFNGKVEKFTFPITDWDRYFLILGIKEGWFIPMNTNGDPS
jgi:hypothetical protein